jgi:glycosyltransferase involved in cell wall biosynthesis
MADLSLPEDTVIIADSHNVEFDVLRRMARAAGSLVRRAYATLQGAATKRAEARCGRRVHSLLATSGRDQALFQRELGLPSVVIPNGIDLSEFERVVAAEGPPTILFAGLMSYHPNDDAIRWFLDAILPLVQQSRPDVHMVVAGAAPASWLRRRVCATLSVTGPVDDMRPYLRAATVVVAPIRHGGGTRVKVLEAMATGRPVVSTTIGCEGLGITHEDGVLIADDPRGFAEMVLRVLGDPALAARLSDAGHTHVTQCFDWDAIGIQLRAHVRQEIECFNTSGLTARAHL